MDDEDEDLPHIPRIERRSRSFASRIDSRSACARAIYSSEVVSAFTRSLLGRTGFGADSVLDGIDGLCTCSTMASCTIGATLGCISVYDFTSIRGTALSRSAQFGGIAHLLLLGKIILSDY